MEEPEKSVKFAVAQLIAVLAKHEFRLAVGWPELIAFLQTGLTSQVTLFCPDSCSCVYCVVTLVT